MKPVYFRNVFFLLGLIGMLSATGSGFAGEDLHRTPEEALALLKEGNARFVAMKMEHPDQNASRREETAARGQKPFATVLSCADSRVPVEMIFDQGIGDIFVVRVAGNISPDPSVFGSLEYAAGHVHAPLLVVLGHTQCGAVGAAVSGAEGEGGVREILHKIEPIVAQVKVRNPELQGEALTDKVAEENVLQAEKDLLAESEEIRELVAKGALKVVPAVYDIKTGQVHWISEAGQK